MTDKNQTLETVKKYYGKILKTKRDLKTGACCASENFPPHLRDIAQLIHPDVMARSYGCGSPLPEALAGKTVLDLGCGTGRDCFIASKLVGPQGAVIGVDMTAEQIETAQHYLPYHMDRFGFSRSNVEFKSGYIEDLEGPGIKNESVDVVISNCVINLSPEKGKVFGEIFRVLKPGGELYFSDVFAGRRLSPGLMEDTVLLGECLGGALYFEDFRRLLLKIGVNDYRVVTRTPIPVTDPEIRQKTGNIDSQGLARGNLSSEHSEREGEAPPALPVEGALPAPVIDFHSLTIRAFKLKLEDRCEDYGQAAVYLGTIPECPDAFRLDDHHLFEKGRVVPVCSNTARILSQSRFGVHFKIIGDESMHYGLFDCNPAANEGPDKKGACC